MVDYFVNKFKRKHKDRISAKTWLELYCFNMQITLDDVKIKILKATMQYTLAKHFHYTKAMQVSEAGRPPEHVSRF